MNLNYSQDNYPNNYQLGWNDRWKLRGTNQNDSEYLMGYNDCAGDLSRGDHRTQGYKSISVPPEYYKKGDIVAGSILTGFYTFDPDFVIKEEHYKRGGDSWIQIYSPPK